MNYPGLQATAARLIKANGKAATIKRAGSRTYTPETGKTSFLASTSISVKVVESEYKASDRDGTIILQNDRRFLISTDGLSEILLTDKLVVGGIQLSIINVTPVQPGEVTIYFEVQCRG